MILEVKWVRIMFKSKNIPVINVSLCVIIFFGTACSNQAAKPDITEIPWHWMALSENEPPTRLVVPNPENYTLTLKSDGTLSIQADCNMVSGTYTLTGNSLTIELGASTMAFCGEQSLDQEFLQTLDLVENYNIENGQLVLNLENNTGEMTFSK